MALGLSDHILITLNPFLMFFGQRCVQSLVYPISKCVFVWFTMIVFNHFLFLKAILKGLKQLTSYGCKVWYV